MRYQNSEGKGTGNCQSATYWDIPLSHWRLQEVKA